MTNNFLGHVWLVVCLFFNLWKMLQAAPKPQAGAGQHPGEEEHNPAAGSPADPAFQYTLPFRVNYGPKENCSFM